MFLRAFISLLMLTLAAGCAEPPPYANLDNEGLKQLMADGVPVYDIRRTEEWRQTGVLKDSRLLTFFDANGRVRRDFLPVFTKAVGKDDPVILICRTGNRTDVLSRYLMKELGYRKIFNVEHGISHWIRNGNKVVAP